MSTVTHLIVVDLDGEEIDSFDVETVPDLQETVTIDHDDFLVLYRTWEFRRGAGDYNDSTTVRLRVEPIVNDLADV